MNNCLPPVDIEDVQGNGIIELFLYVIIVISKF